MKTLLLLAVTLAVTLSAIVPPPSHHDGFYVATVNETSVCVVNRTVYQDGERLPMEDNCEICRCRPPGFACAYVRCAKRDPKPGCSIVELVGQCCPQYRCADNGDDIPLAVPAILEVSNNSRRPEEVSNNSSSQANEGEQARSDVVPASSTQEPQPQPQQQDEEKPEQLSGTSAPATLDERAAGGNSSAVDEARKIPEGDEVVVEAASSSASPPKEEPAAGGQQSRDERVEINEILADPNNNQSKVADEQPQSSSSVSPPAVDAAETIIEARSDDKPITTETKVETLEFIKPAADEPAAASTGAPSASNDDNQQQQEGNSSPSSAQDDDQDKDEAGRADNVSPPATDKVVAMILGAPDNQQQSKDNSSNVLLKSIEGEVNETSSDEPKLLLLLDTPTTEIKEKLDITILRDNPPSNNNNNNSSELPPPQELLKDDAEITLDKAEPTSAPSQPQEQEDAATKQPENNKINSK